MIEFKNVVKEYADIKALDGVSFTVRDGEFVFIVGHSGAGKTTVTKVLLRQEKVTSGQILVDGIDITKLPERAIPFYRRKIGMVFQDFRLFQDKTAYENVAFAMRVVGTPGKEIKQRVPALLRIVNMEAKAGHRPGELSGGEQQRIALARAIANNPDIIVADEPTGNVDPKMSLDIMQMLLRINRKLGKTVLVVTHEKELVDTLGQRVINISHGHVTGDRPPVASEVQI
ncbi:MAG: cell division ATP-binding protein FtsE [Clostridiales bacterium]|nr:cell division ATP-binding protein FtsE [Clostridiales bacterium]MDD6260770.1 cell division ATP-binding protein FtsE [Clostridiales bacterium]HCG68756.1 cell division ATP-binding protein FtsE [Clostridiales bacterium]